MSETPAKPLPPGTRIDRYELGEPIGVGGFGAVYRAKHAILGHPVALKLLHESRRTSPDLVERFHREARAAAAVGSPHIVTVLDCGTSAEGEPFIVLELLEGEVLQDLLARALPLPVDRALGIALQILDGLDAAHAAGIVHRDLKPANVFVCPDPDTPGADFVKIVDFGISKMRTPEEVRSATRTGVVMGTPSYMAPEQFRGARDVDARADLYSVAVVLYQMLAGRVPHEGTSYEDLVVKVCTESPPPLSVAAPQLPAALAAAVDRGLARDPDGRWPTAGAFALALRTALGDGMALGASVHTVPQPRARASRVPAPAAPPAASAASRASGPGATAWPLPATGGPASMTPKPTVLPAHDETTVPTPATRPASRRGAWIAAGAIVGIGGLALAVIVIVASSSGAPERAALDSRAALAAPPKAGKPNDVHAPSIAVAPLPPVSTAPPPTSSAVVSPPPASSATVASPPSSATVASPPSSATVASPPSSATVASPPSSVPVTAPAGPAPVAPVSGPSGAGAATPTPAAPAEAAPPPQPEPPTPTRIVVHEPRIVGDMDSGAISRIVRGAAGRLDGCRTERTVTVMAQLHFAFGDIPLAAAAPENHGPRDAASCVANRLRSAFPRNFDPESSGIVFVEATLPAR